jgi:hypothetical protein
MKDNINTIQFMLREYYLPYTKHFRRNIRLFVVSSISEARLLQYVKYNLPSTENTEVLLMMSQLTNGPRGGAVG